MQSGDLLPLKRFLDRRDRRAGDATVAGQKFSYTPKA
jgi:hypothetical protein